MKKIIFDSIPYTLNWGEITVEGYDSRKTEALHVFNCNLDDEEKIGRAIRFVTGRILWTYKNLPTNSSHKVVFDIRGQRLNPHVIENMRQEVVDLVKSNINLNNIIEFISSK